MTQASASRHGRPSPGPAATEGLLGAASRLYLASFRSCVVLALLGTLLSAAAGGYASARFSILSKGFSALLNTDAGAADSLVAGFGDLLVRAQAILYSPAVWASLAGSAVIVLVFHGALIAQQDAAAKGCAAAPGAVLLQALRRLPGVLLTLVLFVAATAIGLLLLRIAHAAGGFADTLAGMGLLIAAIWLWGRLQLWLAAMFTGQPGAVAALGSSWTVVRGNWWRASALTTVPYIVIFVLSSVGELAARMASGALGAHSAAGSAVAEVLSLAVGVVTLPMLPVVWLGLYRTLDADKKNPAGGGV